MTVDESAEGPVVIHVGGRIDSSAALVLGVCIEEATESGRAVVVDVLFLDALDAGAAVTVYGAATRLAGTKANLVVACTPAVRTQLYAVGDRIVCRDTLSDALASAISTHAAACPRPSSGADSPAQRPLPIDPRDALQGTYL